MTLSCTCHGGNQIEAENIYTRLTLESRRNLNTFISNLRLQSIHSHRHHQHTQWLLPPFKLRCSSSTEGPHELQLEHHPFRQPTTQVATNSDPYPLHPHAPAILLLNTTPSMPAVRPLYLNQHSTLPKPSRSKRAANLSLLYPFLLGRFPSPYTT